jgi:U3 small nucleolar RNA-associated protein MPP10
VNDELFKRMDQIETEMMEKKDWNMMGEARASERPKDSLLEVHLDFNTATKLPPIITKETTTAIDALIKQRILDELFDDPVLLKGDGKKKRKTGNDTEIDFSKSKKGLGDLYGDDLQKKLMNVNPESFLESELAGPDAPLKREIEDISKDLFRNLDTLSNFHFTPKIARVENQI